VSDSVPAAEVAVSFLHAAADLPAGPLAGLAAALFVAFAFEFINGFHDTANAVATVIYTKSLPAPVAVVYSGFLNFLGVLLGGTAVAFSMVHLLPVDALVGAVPSLALLMVFALLIAGVVWNLGTWALGLPVSSSHALIGAILGVGLSNSLISGRGFSHGVNWEKAGEVGLALAVSPVVGFVAAGGLLLLMKKLIPDDRLYTPPAEGVPHAPPGWIRGVLITTCGGVSFAHGSNDGQKGMGLILLVMIGFLPSHYALNTVHPKHLAATAAVVDKLRAAPDAPPETVAQLDGVAGQLAGLGSFNDVPVADRWELRQALVRAADQAPAGVLSAADRRHLTDATEFVPLWVVIGTAVALGLGTTIGYKRIMVTVAEKIGKTHLTYAQGAAAEIVAAGTILAAVGVALPVSTTQVVSSGIAGTMAANGSGVQMRTVRRVLLAWVLTLPGTMLIAGGLFAVGRAVGIG